MPPPEMSPKGSEKRSPKIPPGFWPQISGVPDNFPRKRSDNPCNVVESQQKWSSYEVNSRILDDDYLRWHLFYLTNEPRTQQQEHFPRKYQSTQLILLSSSPIATSLSMQCLTRICDPLTKSVPLIAKCIFGDLFCSQQNQQLLFYSYLYLFTIFPWQL